MSTYLTMYTMKEWEAIQANAGHLPAHYRDDAPAAPPRRRGIRRKRESAATAACTATAAERPKRRRKPKPAAVHTLDSLTLRSMLRMASVSTDAESKRYVLGCIQFRLSACRILLTATDSRRLHRTWHAADVPGFAQSERLVALADCRTLAKRLAGKARYPVTITTGTAEDGAETLTFTAPDWSETFTTPDGRFPRCDDVIPCDSSWRATADSIPAAALLAAVKAVRDLPPAVSDSCQPFVDLAWDRGHLRVSSGDFTAYLDCEYSLSGKPFSVRLNCNFVWDHLYRLDRSATVRIRARDPETPAMLDSGDSLALIMPVYQGDDR